MSKIIALGIRMNPSSLLVQFSCCTITNCQKIFADVDEMGILLDGEHWSRAVNAMWELKPPRERPMPRGSVVRFLEIACKSLQDLISDKDFHADLQTVSRIADAAPDVPPKDTIAFQRFLNRLLAAERALLIQSGMNERAAHDLLVDVDQVARSIDDLAVDPQDFEKKLRSATEQICSAARGEAGTLRDEQRQENTWRVIKGCTLVAVDGGAVAAANAVLPILGGLISGGPAVLSIAIGSAMVTKVVTG